MSGWLKAVGAVVGLLVGTTALLVTMDEWRVAPVLGLEFDRHVNEAAGRIAHVEKAVKENTIDRICRKCLETCAESQRTACRQLRVPEDECPPPDCRETCRAECPI